MISNIWNAIAYNPIYNLLVYLVDIIPGGDVGIAIIGATIIVKLILFPLSLKAVRTQIVLKQIQPKIKKLQEKFKDKKEEQAKELMGLYKKYKINPFSSLLLFIIQIPIIIALYFVFVRESFPSINTEILYSFVAVPEQASLMFLGIIDVSLKSFPLAVLAGITQFIQIKYALPAPEPKKEGEEPSLKDDLTRNMYIQMKYILPVLMGIFAYVISAVIALYFITSNVFAILQEIYMRKTVKKEL